MAISTLFYINLYFQILTIYMVEMHIHLREWEVEALFRKFLIEALVHLIENTPIEFGACPGAHRYVDAA